MAPVSVGSETKKKHSKTNLKKGVVKKLLDYNILDGTFKVQWEGEEVSWEPDVNLQHLFGPMRAVIMWDQNNRTKHLDHYYAMCNSKCVGAGEKNQCVFDAIEMAIKELGYVVNASSRGVFLSRGSKSMTKGLTATQANGYVRFLNKHCNINISYDAFKENIVKSGCQDLKTLQLSNGIYVVAGLSSMQIRHCLMLVINKDTNLDELDPYFLHTIMFVKRVVKHVK